MRKNIIVIFNAFLLTGFGFFLNSCDYGLKIENISFEDQSFVYDGQTHEIKIETGDYQIPDNISVIYENNCINEVGTQIATASFYYKEKTLISTLTANLETTPFIVSAPSKDIKERPYSGLPWNYYIQDSKYYSYTGNEYTNAGNYQVTISLNDKKNYCWNNNSSDDLIYDWTIDKVSIDIPTYSKTIFDFDGMEKSIEAEYNNLYTVTGDKDNIAGKHQAVFSLNDKSNYQWETNTSDDIVIDWEILPQKVSIPEVTNKSFSYTGESITFDVVDDSRYELSNNVQIEAGKYIALLSLKDKTNNCWEDGTTEDKTISWEILPKKIEKPMLSYVEYAYIESDIDLFSSYDDYCLITNKIESSKGDYVSTFTIKDKKNYCWEDGTIEDVDISWSIKDEGCIVIPAYTFIYSGNKLDYSLLENSCFEVINKKEIKNAGNYQITLSLIKDNVFWSDGTTKDKTISLVIEPSLFNPESLTIEGINCIYDGLEHKVEALGTIPTGIEVSYFNNDNVNAGEYDVLVSIKNSSNNFIPFEFTKTVKVLIEKATFDISSISYTDTTKEYNGKEQSFEIEGELPEGITAVYTNNIKKELGRFTSTVSFEVNENYHPITETFSAKNRIVKGHFDVSSIVFEDKEVNYDGNEHQLEYDGFIPEGIEVSYQGGYKQIETGEYTGYLYFVVTNELLFYDVEEHLEATLTINKGNYDTSMFSFKDKTIYYDKLEHSLEIDGELPAGLSVSYNNNKLVGSQDESCSITATVFFNNLDSIHYNDLDSIEATLTIVPKEITIEIENSNGITSKVINRYTKISDIGNAPFLSGYSFVKYIDRNSNDVDSSLEITEEIHLIAVYELASYSIHLDVNGGKLQEETDDDLIISYQSQYELPIPTNDDSNQEFVGWFDSRNNCEIPFSNGIWDYNYEEDESYILTAIWKYNGVIDKDISFVTGTDYIEVTISSINDSSKGFAYLYAMNPSAYYYQDTNRGISTNIFNSLDVYAMAYKYGYNAKTKIPRYTTSGIDLYSYKFYLADNDTIIYGPLWCTEIDALYDNESIVDSWNLKSKKGLTTASHYYMDNLNLNYSTIGLNLNGLILPNELVENGKETLIDWKSSFDTDGYKTVNGQTFYKESFVEYVYNGKTYFIRENAFGCNWDAYYKALDNYIACSTYDHCVAALDIFLKTTSNQLEVPYYLRYPGAEKNSAPYMAINTSNEKGANYFGAIFSFIVNRYSGNNTFSLEINDTTVNSTGIIGYYILGNEVDLPNEWNAIGTNSQSLFSQEQYSEELYRELRITSNIISKYNNLSQPLLSFTHYWNYNGTGSGSSYKPYDIVETMISNSNSQGNFEWGLVSHSYAMNLSSTNPIASDSQDEWGISYSTTTRAICVANLEVYDLYFDREGYKMPDGSIRPVLINELGVSTGNYPYTAGSNEIIEKQQAATIAYVYYKAEMLKSIVGFMYFDLYDAASVKAATFGLCDYAFGQKKSFKMWIDIEASNTNKYEDYLTSISYYDRNSKVSKAFGNEDTYLSAIKKVSTSLGSTNIDWDTRWVEMKTRLGVE